jgi:hypothetical protein
MIVEYEQEEYCDIFFTPGTCNSSTGTAALHVSAYSAILRCFEIVVETAVLLYTLILRVSELKI